MKKSLFLVWIGAGLTACSFHSYTHFESKSIPIKSEEKTVNRIDSIISPYRVELEKEMNQVIAFAPEALINERPSGRLGKWVCDNLLNQYKDTFQTHPLFCLLNFGGLRSPINAGNVTIGDIFKVMPFDNQVVLVKMPSNSMNEIITFLRKTTGEPIGGFQLIEGKVFVKGKQWTPTDFWILTSDYLMNGGDKMDFFNQKMEVIQTGNLLRDQLLIAAKKQETIQIEKSERIKW